MLLQALFSWMLQVSAVPFRWRTFLADPRQAVQPFYSEFVASEQQLRLHVAGTRQPAAVVPAQQRSAADVEATVAAAVAAALGEEVAADAPLLQAGLDSLGEISDTRGLHLRTVRWRHSDPQLRTAVG